VKAKLTKRRIALVQLKQSLRLLHSDPVSALTLAGATEEVLGCFARRKGFPPVVDLTAEGIGELFDRAAKPAQPKNI
jgi:hypothetical protein